MSLVRFQRTEFLGEIVIDRPPQNLFNGELLTDLRIATDEAAASGVRAVLVRAEGEDFSAGADVDIFIGIHAAACRGGACVCAGPGQRTDAGPRDDKARPSLLAIRRRGRSRSHHSGRRARSDDQPGPTGGDRESAT